MPRVLIVEDDLKLVQAVEKALSLADGYTCVAVQDPAKALSAAVRHKPDVILLDVRLPGGDGRNILKALRAHAVTSALPVIMVTGLGSEGDRVLGLNLGADDYVVKPFGAMELLARIQAVLRRYRPQAETAGFEALDAGGLRLDTDNRLATLRGKALRLQPKEFDILLLLASQRGRVLSRSYLIENSSAYGLPVSTRSLDTHIKNLRKKLGAAARFIETIPKVGYRFAPKS